MIDAPVASQLDLTGCVRLEPWDLSFSATAGGGGGLSGLQVSCDAVCVFDCNSTSWYDLIMA